MEKKNFLLNLVGEAVVLAPRRRKGESHQFPKGPALNNDFNGLGDKG